MNENLGRFGEHLIVRSKLVVPRRASRLLARERVRAHLSRAFEFPLTVVRAPAGYGKTTAIASALDVPSRPLLWYSLDKSDADALVFLLHLLASFRTAHPSCGDRALRILGQEGGAAKHWASALDALTNDLFDVLDDHASLVLDDFHFVDRPDLDAIVDRLLEHTSPNLHVVLVTRQTPSLPHLAKRRAMGDVLDVTKDDLALTVGEIRELFAEDEGPGLAGPDADALLVETEGWPIALEMLRQSPVWRSGGLDEMLERLPENLEGLFAYLAEEVLAEQPVPLRGFLLDSAVLRQLEPSACDQLLRRTDSDSVLSALEARSLFVTSLGGGSYRYHHLFREFLASRAAARSQERMRRLQRRAGALYQQRGETEEAIRHLLDAGCFTRAASLLERVAEVMIQAGRYETFSSLLDELPASLVDDHPTLLAAHGDAARLTSRFTVALEAYERARTAFSSAGDADRESRALEGAALVYLDTVQPTRAEPLLRRALRLVERRERNRRADLLLLLAENCANRGELDRAERLQAAVLRWHGRPAHEIDPRIYVRQGRFSEARALEERALRRDEAEAERGVPRSHRESTAVLAWIGAFTGEAEAARDYADRALRRGRELHAPIVEVVALSRLGHAWLTGRDADPEHALALYQESLELAERIGVDRFRVESLLGQVIGYGVLGQMTKAEETAADALAVLADAGDRYLTGVVWLALGAAGVLTDHPEASVWLETGSGLAADCGDRYCVCLADLWRSQLALERGDLRLFDDAVGRALRAANAFSLGFLLTAQPFLGLRETDELQRVLTMAAARDVEARIAAHFLRQFAPGSPVLGVDAAQQRTIFVQALGPFRVWRGTEELPKAAWSRGKALKLFQFLLGRPGRPVHREQVQEALWPDARPEASAVGLRVALNALQRALEPDRARDEAPRFVRREGSSLLLDAELVRVDATEFAETVREAQAAEAALRPEAALELYARALTLYRGDYLEDCRYDDWAEERRDELLALFLDAAERRARILVDRGAFDEAADVCQQMIARDRCYEPAYALLIEAQLAVGNRAHALRAFERCRQALANEFGTEPSSELLAMRNSVLTQPRL